MMSPVRFTCRRVAPIDPEKVAAGILDVDQWSSFKGWGPLPGIREARFEVRTDNVVGSVIACVNTDGSRHKEEITVWEPGRELGLRLFGFPRPLRWMAREFREKWVFKDAGGVDVEIVRSFELVPRWLVMWPFVWGIGVMLRQAVKRQVGQVVEMAGR